MGSVVIDELETDILSTLKIYTISISFMYNLIGSGEKNRFLMFTLSYQDSNNFLG
jgi:hypothetical protein